MAHIWLSTDGHGLLVWPVARFTDRHLSHPGNRNSELRLFDIVILMKGHVGGGSGLWRSLGAMVSVKAMPFLGSCRGFALMGSLICLSYISTRECNCAGTAPRDAGCSWFVLRGTGVGVSDMNMRV